VSSTLGDETAVTEISTVATARRHQFGGTIRVTESACLWPVSSPPLSARCTSLIHERWKAYNARGQIKLDPFRLHAPRIRLGKQLRFSHPSASCRLARRMHDSSSPSNHSGLFPGPALHTSMTHPPDLSTKAGGHSHRPLLFSRPGSNETPSVIRTAARRLVRGSMEKG